MKKKKYMNICCNRLKFCIFFKFSCLALSALCSLSELVAVDLAKLFRTMTELFLPIKLTDGRAVNINVKTSNVFVISLANLPCSCDCDTSLNVPLL